MALSFLTYDGASLLSAGGLTKVSLWTGMVAVELYATFSFPSNPASDALLGVLLPGISAAKAPFVVLFGLLLIWFATSLVFLLGVIAQGEYNNAAPRLMSLNSWLHRTKAAHDNTLEAIVVFSATLLITDKFGLDPEVAARWSALVLAARLLCPIFYISGLDFFRTTSFGVHLVSCIFMCGASLFPAAVLSHSGGTAGYKRLV